jgi:hypothetical protein
MQHFGHRAICFGKSYNVAADPIASYAARLASANPLACRRDSAPKRRCFTQKRARCG